MLETLEQWGCETETTMERFLDDKEFYQECYDLFIGGEGLEQLKCELDEGRITDAFVNAHGMKGTASNLGLVPIANVLSSKFQWNISIADCSLLSRNMIYTC